MLHIPSEKENNIEIDSTSEQAMHSSEQNVSVENSPVQDQAPVFLSQEEILFLPEKNQEKSALTQKKEIEGLSTHQALQMKNLSIENLQTLIDNLNLTIIYLEEKKEQQGIDVSEMISMLKKEEEILSKELKIKKDKENELKEAVSKASQKKKMDHEVQELSQKLFEALNKKHIDYSEIESISLKLKQKNVYLITLHDENGKTPEKILWEREFGFLVRYFRTHDGEIDINREKSIPSELYQAVVNNQLDIVRKLSTEIYDTMMGLSLFANPRHCAR